MNVTLKTQKFNTMVSPVEMKCGEIGIIRNWSPSHHIGTVVQKHEYTLIVLGMHAGHSWSGVKALTDSSIYGIELLKSGDTITIE